MEGEAMRMSRLVMVVAAVCFATDSLIEAQGRGHGPAGHGPQIARVGSGPNVAVTNSGGGKHGNPGVTPGESGKGHSKPGTTPGNAGNRGKNAGGGGRGNAGEERGNRDKASGKGEGDPNAADGDRGDADDDRRGNEGGAGRRDADNDQDARGGRRERGGSDQDGASFVAKMNPQQRARLESMLPSGMTLEQAADGFRNQGQFIAALQQSRNHDISFGDLKAQMTGDNPISLGEAMRKLGVTTEED